mgnify:FL=1
MTDKNKTTPEATTSPNSFATSNRLPAELLQSLLQMLQVTIEHSVLQAACDKAEEILPADVAPADQARYIFTQLQLKTVQPVQLLWRRFDLRRLPALVFYQETWYLAERVDAEQIQLQNAQGRVEVLEDEELQNALVLWLRAAKQSTRTATGSLKGSIAARLVFRELMREPAWIAKVLIATLIINILAVATSLFAMQVYDRVVPTLAYATFTTLVVGMLLIVSIDWLLKTLRARILDSVSIAVDKRVSQQVFDHLLHLRLDHQPKSLGTLAAQVGGLDSVRQFFSSGVVFSLIDLPFAVIFIAFIAVIGGQVGWVYALLLPIALTLGLITQMRLRNLMRKQLMRSNER